MPAIPVPYRPPNDHIIASVAPPIEIATNRYEELRQLILVATQVAEYRLAVTYAREALLESELAQFREPFKRGFLTRVGTGIVVHLTNSIACRRNEKRLELQAARGRFWSRGKCQKLAGSLASLYVGDDRELLVLATSVYEMQARIRKVCATNSYDEFSLGWVAEAYPDRVAWMPHARA